MTTTEELELNVRSAAAAMTHLHSIAHQHAIMNTPSDPAARRRAMEEHALAQARLWAAETKLRAAQVALANHLAGRP